jgi:ABC-type lipoprotein export system ATPase subunit
VRWRARGRADLLLADEPTGNLDADNATVFERVTRLHLSRR